MKKLIIILFAFFCLNASAISQSNTWIQTENGTTYCKRLVVKHDFLRVVQDNGEKKDVPVNDVIAYSDNGKIFKKLPFRDKESGNIMAFMELIASKDGMSLYSYRDHNGDYLSLVYKNDKLYQIVNEYNRKEFSDYFMTNVY